MAFPNPLHELGSTGVKLPACGFGAMGMSEFYGPVDNEKSRAVLREAIQHDCTFWDTADSYGSGRNEELLSALLQESRDKIFVATKFGPVRDAAPGARYIRGDREYVLQACDASLKRLGIKQIDLYYLHRVDPLTPIEETVAAMKELQDAGKIKYLGLSECSSETLERALKIARIEAVQVEYSPWETSPERTGLLATMRKHKVSLVAYSPLGRGLLTGAIKSPDDLAADDWRRSDPRFQGEAFHLNLRIADKIAELAKAKSQATGTTVTPAAFCLAWVLFQGKDFFVIPGTKSAERMKENLTSGRVLETFTKEDDEAVRTLIKELDVVGERYSPQGMAMLNK